MVAAAGGQRGGTVSSMGNRNYMRGVRRDPGVHRHSSRGSIGLCLHRPGMKRRSRLHRISYSKYIARCGWGGDKIWFRVAETKNCVCRLLFKY